MMYTIGVDIGGMTIKVGLVDEQGNIVIKDRVKTNTDPYVAIKDTVELINKLLEKYNVSITEITGIGIGCPGSVKDREGILVYTNNLPWYNVNFREELKKYFNLPVEVANDANAAALGEVKYGVAKGYSNAVMLTLGTGVGGGVIIDKKIFSGSDGFGTELGHTTLVYGGKLCTCGRRGCLESYASATALMEQAREEMKINKNSKMWNYVSGDIMNVDGKIVFDCMQQGDESAKKVVDTYVNYVSEGIINMLNIFRPDIFIIGGGVSSAGKVFFDKIIKKVEEEEYGYAKVVIDIVPAKLGNDAGIIGAASLIG
ncbi:MAG: ROK family protein [Clostridia bacterium]|nr:ROK family protein [Clostridia bacterium]